MTMRIIAQMETDQRSRRAGDDLCESSTNVANRQSSGQNAATDKKSKDLMSGVEKRAPRISGITSVLSMFTATAVIGIIFLVVSIAFCSIALRQKRGRKKSIIALSIINSILLFYYLISILALILL